MGQPSSARWPAAVILKHTVSIVRPPSALAVSACTREPQVKGHVAANLNVGNDRARLIDVLTHLLPFIGDPRALNGLRVVDEVAPASDDPFLEPHRA